MEFRKTTAFFLLLIFVAALTSCSDDPISNPNDNNNTILKDFFPNKAGNYWIYESYLLNDDNEKIVETVKIDSMVNTGTELKAEKTADVYRTYNELKEEISVQHYYKEDSTKLFIHSDYINFLINKNLGGFPIELPFKISDSWLKIVDYNQNTWKVFDTTFTNFALTDRKSVV